jgi:hypothetical protein
MLGIDIATQNGPIFEFEFQKSENQMPAAGLPDGLLSNQKSKFG